MAKTQQFNQSLDSYMHKHLPTLFDEYPALRRLPPGAISRLFHLGAVWAIVELRDK